MPRRKIQVGLLTRVEGEGGLTISLRKDEPQDVKLRIFEPPRLFEALLRGRSQLEVPDITARICGICPVAYQMSACHAIEAALQIRVEGSLRELRRLLYCGEWIESHVLHAFMLHAPDFLGYEDALQMARDHPNTVTMALRMKKAGNSIVRTLGGREIHPINVRIGGFYRVPGRQELQSLVDELRWGRDAAADAVSWSTRLDFPEFSRNYEFVALQHPEEYALNEGRLVSNKGLDIAIDAYEEHFEEQQVEHSNALHSLLKQRGDYMVGPLARYNLNFEQLSPSTQQIARDARLPRPCLNPFMSLPVRLLETHYAFDEALRIITSYEPPDDAHVEVPQRSATGAGCTEAPRGLLFHRYRVDDGGLVQAAKIVPPTAQNQKCIEADLFQLAPQLAKMPLPEATWKAEQAIRNYDPCISCATHFLELRVMRS